MEYVYKLKKHHDVKKTQLIFFKHRFFRIWNTFKYQNSRFLTSEIKNRI